MAKTKKVSKTRARSYRRRAKSSPCKGKGPAVCRSLKPCKYTHGKKRSFCRRSKSTRKLRKSLSKKTRSGKKYGGSRPMGGSRRRSRRTHCKRGGSLRRSYHKRGGSRPSMGGSRRRSYHKRGGSRLPMGGSRRRSRKAGSRRSRKAGTFGILEQAIVPGSLLLANTYYKSKGSKKSRRSRFRKRRSSRK